MTFTMIDDGTIKAYANACLLNKPTNNDQLLGVYDFTTGDNQIKASNVVPGIKIGDITSTSLKFKFINDEIQIRNWPTAISITGGSCINIPITKQATASAFNISKIDVTLRRGGKKPIQMNFGSAVNSSQITFAKDTPFGRIGYHTYSLMEGAVGTGVSATLIPAVNNLTTQYLSIGTTANAVSDTVYIDKIEVYGTVSINTSTNNSESESNYKVFVNSNNKIFVQAPEKSQIDVYNLMGQQLQQFFTSTANENIATQLCAGTYLVRLTVDGQVKTQKIIIR
jgi:hypothetical protein